MGRGARLQAPALHSPLLLAKGKRKETGGPQAWGLCSGDLPLSKKTQSSAVGKVVKADFIQDYCNRRRETSVWNRVQFRMYHGQVGIYIGGRVCQWMEN